MLVSTNGMATGYTLIVNLDTAAWPGATHIGGMDTGFLMRSGDYALSAWGSQVSSKRSNGVVERHINRLRLLNQQVLLVFWLRVRP